MLRQCTKPCGVLPSGHRTIDPDCRGFRVAGAYRNGQAVESRNEKGRARAAPRCDPSHWRVLGPHIKDVDGSRSTRHVDPLAFAIEKDVVDVPARLAFSNRCSRFHVPHAKLRRISEDNPHRPARCRRLCQAAFSPSLRNHHHGTIAPSRHHHWRQRAYQAWARIRPPVAPLGR